MSEYPSLSSHCIGRDVHNFHRCHGLRWLQALDRAELDGFELFVEHEESTEIGVDEREERAQKLL